MVPISFALIMRVEMPTSPGAFSQLAAAIGDAGGVIAAVDMRAPGKSTVVRDVTVNVSSESIGKAVREAVEALEWCALASELLFEPVRRREDRLVEEGEEQLVLAGEVLVEAAERLPRAVHHLLDGELLAGLGPGEQLEPGIEEPLDPSLAPQPGRVEGARHGQVAPSDRLGGGGRAGRGVVN